MATKRSRVGYDEHRGYLKLLEERCMLKHISGEVDLDSELGAIAYRDLVKDRPGLWFDNVKDYPVMPMIANVMYQENLLRVAFNGDANWADLRDLSKEGKNNWLASNEVPTGTVKDVKIISEDIDRGMLLKPKWHEEDGRSYIGTWHPAGRSFA
jgi:UbiD family decarboxylase